MSRHEDLVPTALVEPQAPLRWSAERITQLFQQARAAALLGRIGVGIESAATAPWQAAALGHLDSARRVARAQAAEVERELRHVAQALAPLGAPVVLLKGAAYLSAGLPAARGRVFSDVDIMVPRSALPQAESLLMLAGWMTTKLNAYDQRYYREWSHELPPMEHVHRRTALDVHHTILPPTARLRPDAGELFAAARALPDRPGLHVLAPPDMVLHSMTHLFMNEEMSHALRDLSDLDLLLRHFSDLDVDFWSKLRERAARLDLRRPLHYGLRHAAALLGTPVPADTLAQSDAWGPAWAAPMDALWRRALRSPHPSAALPGQRAALFALYLRGHWLRMPPLMLVRHLSVKALGLHERGEAAAAGG